MMRKLSLMTMTMYMRIFFKFNLDHDMEDLQDGYEEMLDMIQEAGYSSIDVTAMEITALGEEFVCNALQRRGLNVSSYIYFGNFAEIFENDFRTRVAQGKQAADTAVELGTKILMLVPQAQKNIDELTPEQIRKQMILHWREIVPYAKDRGLHVVVEDTPDLQLHFCKAEDVREVLDAVPDLELVYDSGNMILAGEDPVKYIEKFRDRIGFVHLKDMRKAPEDLMMADISKDGELMSTAPTGFGMIDLQGVIKKLDEIGYNGGMTIEFFVDDDRDYIKSLKRSREYIERI